MVIGEMSDITLILGYIGVTKALLDVAEKAYNWAQRVLNESKNERERQDARILATSGVLVASIRTIDNMFRSLVSELRLFDSSWSQERRSRVISRIREFAEQEDIIRRIRETLSELETLQYEDDGISEHVDKLVSYGKSIINAMGESDVTPFPNVIEMRKYLLSIKNAQNEQDVQFVIEDTDKLIDAFNRDILRDIDETFGQLRGEIKNRNPKIPDPGCSTSEKLVTG